MRFKLGRIIDVIRGIVPELDHFVCARLCSDQDPVGYTISSIDSSGFVLGSGTAGSIAVARAKALNETIERKIFYDLNEEESLRFCKKKFPSTSGCAVGFDRDSARMRSVFEACERRAWSMWIDRGIPIQLIPEDLIELSPLSSWMANHFEKFRLYRAKLDLSKVGLFAKSQDSVVWFNVVLGFSGAGVFPGSRVSFNEKMNWEHSFVEAYRHKVIYDRSKKLSDNKDSIFLRRILFHGEDSSEAINQIRSGAGEVCLDGFEIFLSEGQPSNEILPFYFYRSLCRDFEPWHQGSVERFVY